MYLLLIVVSLVSSGCATIASKSTYPVLIESEPAGAMVKVENKQGKILHTGTTPLTVTLKAGDGFWKGQNYSVTFNKPGYQPQVAKIHRGLDGWYLGGNLLLCVGVLGPIGYLIVDPATGAMWTLRDLKVTLTPVGDRSSGESPAVKVVTLDQVPEHLRPSMVRIN